MAQELIEPSVIRDTHSQHLPARARRGAVILKRMVSRRLTMTNVLLVIIMSSIALGILRSDIDFSQRWQFYLPSTLTVILIGATIALVRSIYALHDDCFSLLTLDETADGTALRTRSPGDVAGAFLRICSDYPNLLHLVGFAHDSWTGNSLTQTAGNRVDRMTPVHDRTMVRLGNGQALPARIIDFSRSGAALSLDFPAEVGTALRVGRFDATVVRTFQAGLAVKFRQQINAGKFNEHFRL